MNSKVNKIVSKEILVNRIVVNTKETNISKDQINKIISEFLKEINQSLVKGEEIRLLGYFTLRTEMAKEREAMNLRTRTKMTIPARRMPKCKFSSNLKKEIETTPISE